MAKRLIYGKIIFPKYEFLPKLQRPQCPKMSAETSSTPHTCAKDGAYIV